MARRIDTAIRVRRFKVSPEVDLTLVIELYNGQQLSLKVVDGSINGLGCQVSPSDFERLTADGFAIGGIIPEAKLTWGDRVCGLGRLIFVRHNDVSQPEILVAFSFIDTKLPMLGALASCFCELQSGKHSPLDYEISSKKFSLYDFQEAEFPHKDLFERCRQYDMFLRDFKKNPLFQHYSVRQPHPGARTKIKLSGTGKTIEAVSFASYDYLGLSRDPEIIAASKAALDKYGMSASGSMVLYGKTAVHEELEQELARFFKKEDALLFNSGFGTNVGTIAGMTRANDLIVADIFSHASLYDGITTSKATARFFKHNDISSARKILQNYREDAYGALLVTEGLFSMEGTIPDLQQFVSLAEEFNCRLFIDEAHSVGVLGPGGRGAAELHDVLDKIDLFMGTFSKGFGAGCGGFVCGDKRNLEFLRYFARTGMFSCAMQPALAAACLKSLHIMQNDSSRRDKLMENITRFRNGLTKMGLSTSAHPQSPIIPVIITSEERMGAMNKIMIDEGVYVNCIVFPAVPLGEARFRFSMTATHQESDIELALRALKHALQETAHMTEYLKGA